MRIPSMKAGCSAREWQARVDLAACYRLLDLYGMSDMMANHISSHVPGEPGAFLIDAYGLMYEEITASSLIEVDQAGNILSRARLRWARPRHQPRRLRASFAADREAEYRKGVGGQGRPPHSSAGAHHPRLCHARHGHAAQRG